MNAFPRSRRLLKRADYDHVFQDAKKLVSPHFILLYRDNSLDVARLGLALSKKMIAKAHDRARLKRLVRETFRVQQQLPAVDVIILARSGVAKVGNAELIDSLKKNWSKL